MTVSYRQFSGTAAENYQRHFVPAISTPVSVDLLRTAGLKPGERASSTSPAAPGSSPGWPPSRSDRPAP